MPCSTIFSLRCRLNLRSSLKALTICMDCSTIDTQSGKALSIERVKVLDDHLDLSDPELRDNKKLFFCLYVP